LSRRGHSRRRRPAAGCRQPKSREEGQMTRRLTRRTLLGGAAGSAFAASLPVPAIAEANPIKIGLLTIKTGPLASAGIQMEQGTVLFLKDREHRLAGRKAELVVADTGGNPAGAKTKAQELIERDKVDLILGPLAAFELLAISDYVAGQNPAAGPRSGRGHDPATAQLLFCPRLGYLGAGDAPAGGLCGQGPQLQERDHRVGRFCFRLRADGRLSASVRRCRRVGKVQTMAAARHPRL